jgi:hypothetical protein
MAKYKGVPIKVARALSREFDKDQVIIVTWDAAHKKMHVTTYGKTLLDCSRAAEGGNFVKRALGWPEKLCNDKLARVRRSEAKRP